METLVEGRTATVSGAFNICLTAQDSEPRVNFEWDGGEHSEGVPLYCIAGSDDGFQESMTLPVGQHDIDIWSPNVERFTVTIIVEEGAELPTPPTTGDGVRIQVGPWFPFPSNLEEPYINLLHASKVSWTEQG